MKVDLEVTLDQLRKRRGSKWTAYDEATLPAWVADMDFPIAEPIKAAIVDVLERNDLGYPGSGSAEALSSAFCERMVDRFGWEPEPRRVQALGDLIQAMFSTVTAFCEPGDGVVIQTPIYPPFLQIVAVQKRRIVQNPLVANEGRDEMNLAELRSLIDERTRMILFCNPHNPTGRVFERRELERLAEIALENDLIVVSDEVHSDLIYPGSSHTPFASLGPEVAARTITLTAATKAFNIAGLKCALLHFGSRELMRRHTAAFQPRFLGVPNILGIEATLAAWRSGGPWLEAVLERLDANRRRVSDFLAQRLPQVGFRRPEASYFAWLDCEALALPERAQPFFLNTAKVALNDGQEFGGPSPNHVRLNFATSPAVLDQILERMHEAVVGS